MSLIRYRKRAVTTIVALATLSLLGMAAPAQAGGRASGDPVRVMTIGTIEGGLSTDIEQTSIAAAEWINRNGGLGPEGRPVEAIFCDDQDNDGGARDCANQAVELANDPDNPLVALVGGYSTAGAFQIYPVLEENGVPWIGAGAVGPSWENARMAYPFAGGGAPTWMRNGVRAGEQGCERAGAIHWANPIGDDATEYFRHGLATQGGEVVHEGVVGFDATDLGPPVAAAAGEGVDCLMFGMSPEQGNLVVPAVQELGIDATLVFYPDGIDPSTARVTGGRQSPAQNGVTSSWFQPIHNRAWRQAKRTVRRFADPDQVVFSRAFNFQVTWVAYMGLVDIFDKLDPEVAANPTPADMLAFLDSGEPIDPAGLTHEPVSFAENVPVKEPGGGDVTRVFNPWVVSLTIRNAQFRCVRPCEFHDMTELMASYQG